MKHTPGPWKAEHSGYGDAIVIGPEITGIPAPFTPTVIGGRLNWDDARLIAAAPDMLAALESAKQFLHEVHCRWPEDATYGGSVLIDVDKALHNAKGE